LANIAAMAADVKRARERAEDLARQLRDAIAAEAKRGSQKTIAERLKISPQYLNDICRGRRNPMPDAMVDRIIEAFQEGTWKTNSHRS